MDKKFNLSKLAISQSLPIMCYSVFVCGIKYQHNLVDYSEHMYLSFKMAEASRVEGCTFKMTPANCQDALSSER
jgi:hypothetical protein